MTDREKLVELAKPVLTSLPFPWCTVWRDVAEKIADTYIAHGATVQEKLVAKQVVIDKKYGSTRCPSCNALLGVSSHYCWQCGQKVTHKLPQPPKGE